jgi:hypothetical protein
MTLFLDWSGKTPSEDGSDDNKATDTGVVDPEGGMRVHTS